MGFLRHRFSGLLGSLMLAGTGLVTAGVPRYDVRPAADLRTLTVEACFADGLPGHLVADDERAPALVREVRVGERRLAPQRLASGLPRASGASCVEYVVALPGREASNWHQGFWRTNEALVVSPRLWLWRPETLGVSRLEITFTPPAGQSVVTPWSELAGTAGRTVYRSADRPGDWGALIALGRFDTRALRIGGATLHVAVLDGDPAVDRDAMVAWVESRARALTGLNGQFPVPRLQVLVVPVGRSGEAVPWGQVLRGGGDAVHLFIDQTRPLKEFREDWVLMHELSHLLHPLISSHDRWWSEGLASYYQNVARARGGLMPPATAWKKLHAGFQRGIRGTPAGRSLANVSENMLRDRLFMRVYWSGAAIALLADVELRSLSGGTQSLDTALRAFADCCLPASRTWTAREMTDRLDALTATRVLSRLYTRYADSDRFPELADVYARLGLRSHGNILTFDDNAAAAGIRQAIMQDPGS